MAMMDGDDLHRLWSLIEDLTNQLSANRQLCESLQAQADQLKGQAIHSGTGFALRRFNTDISKEMFESELEQLNAHLVKENQSLAHENKQQALLLREYENTLETVMGKFRSFSHSTQQHTLRLTAHYENILASTTQNAAEATLNAETTFSGTLTHLGILVRKALRTMDGETTDSEDEDAYPSEYSQSGASGIKSQRARQNGWSADPRWYGSGGYTGKDLDPDVVKSERALEVLTENERLAVENETLKELLGLKERSDALVSPEATFAPAAAPPPPAPVVVEQAASVEPTITTSASTLGQGGGPSSPVSSRQLAVDSAAILAEASGQPPTKGLEISETIRPSSLSPKVSPADKILEEAIQEEEDGETQGPRGRDASGIDLPLLTSKAEAEIPSLEGGPNLVAEAGPSALLSTGIEEGEEADASTTVTSVSGSEPDSEPNQPQAEVTAAEPSETAAEPEMEKKQARAESLVVAEKDDVKVKAEEQDDEAEVTKEEEPVSDAVAVPDSTSAKAERKDEKEEEEDESTPEAEVTPGKAAIEQDNEDGQQVNESSAVKKEEGTDTVQSAAENGDESESV